MTKFVCPRCKAENLKESTDLPGCAACGYGSPRFYQQQQPQVNTGARISGSSACPHCHLTESQGCTHYLLG